MSISALTDLLSAADFPWWIAGGYALELAIGEPIREHADIDVLILRRDQLKFRRQIGNWDCWAADPPGTLRPWLADELLPAMVHDIWCRTHSEDDWRFQAMIDEADDQYWCSRRDLAVRLPLTDITRSTANGVPYLAPHVQLFYKAKRSRPKDEIDFDTVLSSGIEVDYGWLYNAIKYCHGADHDWLARIRAVQTSH